MKKKDKNNKKKSRIKGFTLVELIAVIVILAILLIIGVSYFNDISKSSKEKSERVLKNSALESARIFVGEYLNEINWTEDGSNKRSCVTINKLIEKGLLKEEKNNILTSYKEKYSVEIKGVNPDIQAYEYELIDITGCTDLSNLIKASISQTGTTTNSITVEATCADTGYDITSYEFSLDRINWSAKTTNRNYTFNNLKIGEYLASVRCTNSISQTKIASDAVATDGLDRPIFNVNPPSEWAHTKLVTITYPNKEGFTCRYKKITDDTWTDAPSCSDKPVVPFTENGVLIAEITDGTNSRTNTITIEKIKNILPLVTASVPDGWTNTPKTAKLTGEDNAGVGINAYCVIATNNSDLCTWKNSTSTSYDYAGLTNGTYYAFVKNNVNAISIGYQFTVSKIDTIAPTIAFTPDGNTSGSTTQSTTVNVSDTGGSGLANTYYAWSTSTTEPASINLSFTPGTNLSQSTMGNWYLWIKATDNAGNVIVKRSANYFNVASSTYTIVYSSNGGSGSMNNQTCTVGQTCRLSYNSFYRTNYTFSHWQDSLGYNYSENSTYSATGGSVIYMYAIWNYVAPPTSYNYYINNRPYPNYTAYESRTCTSSFTISNPYSVDSGYILTGWYDSSSGTTYGASASIPCTQSRDIYPVWTYQGAPTPTCTTTGDSTSWINSSRTIYYGCSNCQSGAYYGSTTFSSTTITGTIPSYTVKDNSGASYTCPSKTVNVYVDKTAPSLSASGSTVMKCSGMKASNCSSSSNSSAYVSGYWGGTTMAQLQADNNGRIKVTCTDGHSGANSFSINPGMGASNWPYRDGKIIESYGTTKVYGFFLQCANPSRSFTYTCYDVAGNAATYNSGSSKVFRCNSSKTTCIADEATGSNCLPVGLVK